MTWLIVLVYVETKTELSGPFWLGVVYDENQIGQKRDQSYRCSLC